MGKLLYHYTSNQGCFGILKEKEIWMSDIRKSNDNREMMLFFPEVMHVIIKKYDENPFEFEIMGLEGKEAVRHLVWMTQDFIEEDLQNGAISNFVVSFSREPDLLSQWRGYADNAKGCCLAFDQEMMEAYCDNTKGELVYKEVKYLSRKEIVDEIEKRAVEALAIMKSSRAIVKKKKKIMNPEEMDSERGFLLYEKVRSWLVDSLGYKEKGFEEEKEWRMMRRENVSKDIEWTLKVIPQADGTAKRIHLVDDVCFRIFDDDLKPYIPAKFEKFDRSPIVEVWTGPKSKMAEADVKLFLDKYKYSNVSVRHSALSYR